MPRHPGARIQRIDRINCFTPDVQTSPTTSTRGSRLPPDQIHRDRRQQIRNLGGGLHRKGNVHDLAFTNGRGPRLHHVGVWTASALDILHTCDVMATSGYLPEQARPRPGRHGISNAFFLYIRDPDGHRVELFTSDYLTVDTDHEPIRRSLRDPQRQTLWGHQRPSHGSRRAAEFAAPAGARADHGACPIVAR